MKTQFVIHDADPVFLAALLETMAAMQAEKDQENEIESFAGRFPDFESPDLEWIRDNAADILKRRGDIEAAEVFDKVFPPCRHFRSRDGDEWKMPVNGERGQLKMAKRDLWEPSSSSLKDFIERDTGKARPGYEELGEGPDCELPFGRSANGGTVKPVQVGKAWEIAQKEVLARFPRARCVIPAIGEWAVYLEAHQPLTIASCADSEAQAWTEALANIMKRGDRKVPLSPLDEIGKLLSDGIRLVSGKGVDHWIQQAESYLLFHGITPARLHTPPVDGPVPSPTLKADVLQDQASS